MVPALRDGDAVRLGEVVADFVGDSGGDHETVAVRVTTLKVAVARVGVSDGESDEDVVGSVKLGVGIVLDFVRETSDVNVADGRDTDLVASLTESDQVDESVAVMGHRLVAVRVHAVVREEVRLARLDVGEPAENDVDNDVVKLPDKDPECDHWY